MEDITVTGEGIRLGQFLKLANVIDSGADAKSVLGADLVRVNGDPETRRGRQLVRGDVVEVSGREFRVA